MTGRSLPRPVPERPYCTSVGPFFVAIDAPTEISDYYINKNKGEENPWAI